MDSNQTFFFPSRIQEATSLYFDPARVSMAISTRAAMAAVIMPISSITYHLLSSNSQMKVGIFYIYNEKRSRKLNSIRPDHACKTGCFYQIREMRRRVVVKEKINKELPLQKDNFCKIDTLMTRQNNNNRRFGHLIHLLKWPNSENCRFAQLL